MLWLNKKPFSIYILSGANIVEIVLKKVTKNYQLGQTTVEALKGVNLTVKSNDFLTVAGPSGSGKTSLLNMIGCIDSPTSGTVLFDGVDVNQLNLTEKAILRNEKIGFIFQSFNLMPVLSVYENIELPTLIGKKPRKRKETRDWIMHLITSVGLESRVKHKPDELSGGQRQRVAIARALVNNPALILADEPTANLDSDTSLIILDLMRQLNKEENTAFLFSTHDPDIVARCDTVIHVRDGLIVDTLLQTPVATKPTAHIVDGVMQVSLNSTTPLAT
jgi:putative ABC transport system ATP-binding protein